MTERTRNILAGGLLVVGLMQMAGDVLGRGGAQGNRRRDGGVAGAEGLLCRPRAGDVFDALLPGVDRRRGKRIRWH